MISWEYESPLAEGSNSNAVYKLLTLQSLSEDDGRFGAPEGPVRVGEIAQYCR